ncbi:MAG: FAD-binding oxidoreductase [Corticimicrobacter sp.]|uniref:NAD(P)/FAD-dependent oxidoreductase n=1 Tax=Corticimicrobacter sp. TaxID=2678536 RepID=UPI0032DBE993
MATVSIIPANDTTNGWNRILPLRTTRPALTQDRDADWVVVGAGQAGLAAARRLGELHPGDTILLLEADEVGQGAQGRNAGFIIDTPHNVGSSLGELSAARDHIRLARAAISSLSSLVERHHIACDWDASGKLHGAVSAEGIETILKPTRATLQALDEPHEWIDGQALRNRIGFGHFAAAIQTPGAVLVNPAALARGLADNLPSNVTLHEKTPVTALQTAPDIRLTTPGGTIRAGKLILATNVFLGQFGYYRHHLIPIAAYASLTRPLDSGEQAALEGLPSWGLTPANAFVGVTARRTRDQRILIRQNMSYEPRLVRDDASRQQVATEHQALFNRWFPALRKVTIEHTWNGFICFSRNGGAAFGQVAPNVYAAACDNGLGWTKGTISGTLIADKASGEDNPLLPIYESLGQVAALPPRPFLDIGVRARFGWELWRHRNEA